MQQGMSGASVTFIGIFFTIMLVPCIGAAIIGVRLIDKLGRFPSKTPAVQMSVMLQIIILEVVSMTLLVALFKVLTSD